MKRPIFIVIAVSTALAVPTLAHASATWHTCKTPWPPLHKIGARPGVTCQTALSVERYYLHHQVMDGQRPWIAGARWRYTLAIATRRFDVIHVNRNGRLSVIMTVPPGG